MEDDMTHTNIKNLPEGKTYWTEYGYSQSYVWVEVSRTAKTVTLANVYSQLDPDWKPEIHVGGFAGHCSNQNTQTWKFMFINEDYKRTIRLTKKGWRYKGTKFVENVAREFCDYNF
jgi:hypothetical protein